MAWERMQNQLIVADKIFWLPIFIPPKRRKTWKSILITIITPKQFSNNADETADEEIPTSNVGGTGQHQGRGHRHSKSRKWSLTPSILFNSLITIIIIIIRMAISMIIYVIFTGKRNNDFVIDHDLYKDILLRSTPWRYWPYSTMFVRVSILHSVLHTQNVQQYPVGDFCFWVCLALCPQCQPIANFCGSGIISVSISQHAWLDAQTAAVCGELLWLRHNLCGLPSTFVVWAVFPGPVSNFCGNSPTPCGFPNDPPQSPELDTACLNIKWVI